jgi:hypothetical protein
MTWYPDLGHLNYFDDGPVDSTNFRAIGWLARNQEFSQGAVNPPFLERLRELLLAPWQPLLFMGVHSCELCPPQRIVAGKFVVPMGSHNLFIPGERCVYVAPELIVHYIEAHQYKPPEEFVGALLACPPTGSAEYQRRLLDANDGRPLVGH